MIGRTLPHPLGVCPPRPRKPRLWERLAAWFRLPDTEIREFGHGYYVAWKRREVCRGRVN